MIHNEMLNRDVATHLNVVAVVHLVHVVDLFVEPLVALGLAEVAEEKSSHNVRRINILFESNKLLLRLLSKARPF